MFRVILVWVVFPVAFIGGAAFRAHAAEGPALSRGPVVQLTTESSAVLVWRTVGPTDPVVRFGTDLASLDHVVAPAQITQRVAPQSDAPAEVPRLSEAPPDTIQYEALLTGMEEDSVYYYAIYDGDTLLAGQEAGFYLRTAPPAHSGRPLRFWVVGDSGNGSAAQIAAFTAMKQFAAGDGRPVDAFLHLGDMAYGSGRDTEFQQFFFAIYASLLRNTVTWATMGNHEGRTSNGPLGIGPYYDAYVLPTAGEAGGVPSGSEAFYSFDFGPIHFVCLNSHDEERSQVGRMATWLRADLVANQSDWLIAFWHHPPYTKGTHLSDVEDQLVEMREVMMPILEEHGVDLVLAGHSHVYERSMLLDGAYATPTTGVGVILDDGDGSPTGDGPYRKSAQLQAHQGMVAVVAGNGRSASRSGLMPVHRRSLTEVGSVLLDLDGDTLTARMLNRNGVVRDEFQVVKRGEVESPAPLTDPWSPFGPAIVTAERRPGETEVHLFAQPAADDATLYYTLDGTEPTTASPAYAGPFIVGQPTAVRALSAWRGGVRTSPATTRVILPPSAAAKLARTIRIPLLFAEDDAVESELGMVDLHGLSVGVESESTGQLAALRYRDLPFPRNATILAASIKFSPAKRGREPASWTIRGGLAASREPFSDTIGSLGARAKSTTSVSWNPSEWLWTDLVPAWTPDLSAVIEEAVHAPEWQTGDPLTFFFSGTAERMAHSFDRSPGLAPELHVAFHEDDPLTLAASVVPMVEVEETGAGGGAVTRRLLVSFFALNSAARRGFSYLIEGSPNLEPGSWEPLTAGIDRFYESPGPGWFHWRLAVVPPDGIGWGETYFVRVAVNAQ